FSAAPAAEPCRSVIAPFQGEAMGVGISRSVTPNLAKDKQGVTLPVESLLGDDQTAYLEIDLKVDAMGGQPVLPMTAVFAPDPTKLKGPVDVILWLHGDKSYWEYGDKTTQPFAGESIQHYLSLRLCKLREFILASTKTQYLLVAPTLNDRTGKHISKTSTHL